jgi:transcription termination factor Rho
MELHLDRKIAEKRNYPAIKINGSGTRREELIMTQEDLQKLWILRKVMHPMDDSSANEFLIERLRMTKTNEEFFDAMKRQQ